jgi:hypothetical protein
MNFKFSSLLSAAAVVCAGIAGSPAAMAQGTFTPGTGTATNCNIGNSGVSADSKTCTVGSVSVTMTAWGFTGSTLSSTASAGFRQGRLADWDTNGIGALTGSNESGTNGNHAFDNMTSGCGTGSSANGGSVTLSTANSGCGGSIEGLFLDFGSANVSLTSIGIGWNGGDADIMVWAYTGTNNAGFTGVANQNAAGSTTTSGTTAASMAGWTLVSQNNFGSGTGDQNVQNSNLFSSYFLITTYFGANNTGAGLNAGNDSFKLDQFTVGVCTGTLSGGLGGNGSTCGTNITTVPEPGSVALAGIALLGVVASRRQRKSALRRLA